jgi:hypothetical protein
MAIDKKILKEISRFNSINKYISEQVDPALDAALAPPADPALAPDPAAGAPPVDPNVPVDPNAAPADPNAVAPIPPAAPVDIATDPEVEELGDEGEEENKEELDVTDLVASQKNMEQKQEEYFDNLFAQLKTLEEKLGEMDGLVTTINNLETKFDKFRPKTPQEKLELRSLDSGPFNQKLSDFFEDKEPDMEKSGKNEYVLTTDDANNYSTNDVETSFNNYDDEDTNMM